MTSHRYGVQASRRAFTACALAAAVCVGAQATQTTVVNFEGGDAAGWIGPNGFDGFGGGTWVVADGGNPSWNMRTVFQDFGIPYITNSNSAFLGDYTASSNVTLKIDLRVENLKFFGTNVSRPWLVELRNSSLATGGYPWVSVWFKFAQISTATHGQWTTFAVTFDPRATALPQGWRGSGAEDPVTFQPQLPRGITFRDVLKNVDAIAFTTLEPGMFFGFTDHSFRVDNITITRVPVTVPSDLNNDGIVGAPDLAILLAAWGACAPKQQCPADLNNDGVVGPQDLAALLSAWG